MAKQNLKQKAVSGMLWTSIQRFAGMGMSFISGIILARLLTPKDYGAIGMLTIFMLVAQAILDGGFGAALIQKRRPSQEDYSTIFWFNLFTSIVLYFVLFFAAPHIADFYHMPILCNVLRVEAIVLIINAVTIVQVNQLRKQFQFRKIAIVTLFTSIISLVVTILMAYKGFGVWALVVSGLLSSFIPSILYWFTNKWYPRFTISIQSFKDLFSFGFFILLTHIINELSTNIQGLLIGRFYNANTMGYYSKAKSTEKLASTSISQALGQITLPLYSEVQDDKVALISMIKKMTGMIAFVTFPLMFYLILLAKPIFVFLYSERWIPSVPYFQILCLSGIPLCLQSVNLQAISAIGKSKTMFVWTVIKRLTTITLVIVGMYIGDIYGMLVGMVIGTWLIYFINASLVSKHIGYALNTQLKDLLPIITVSVIVCSFSYLVGLIVRLPFCWDAIVKTTCFFTLYLCVTFYFKFSELIMYKNILLNFLNKIRVNKKI